MLAFAMSSLKRAAMWGTSTLTFFQLVSFCSGTRLQAHLMKVGVFVSNPGEDDILIPEIWVATKVRSSSSSGMLKRCGPRGCALLCLRPSWIKLSMADSVPVHCLTCLFVQSERQVGSLSLAWTHCVNCCTKSSLRQGPHVWQLVS